MHPPQIEYSVTVYAPASAVWDALTVPARMTEWMAVPEMKLEVLTDWTVGGPILVQGLHHKEFRNIGTVLMFQPCDVLRYTRLSSISRLPDLPANHTTVEFRLRPSPGGDATSLAVTLTNFPTESIFKHLDFYWRVTIHVLKGWIENHDKPMAGSDATRNPPPAE